MKGCEFSEISVRGTSNRGEFSHYWKSVKQYLFERLRQKAEENKKWKYENLFAIIFGNFAQTKKKILATNKINKKVFGIYKWNKIFKWKLCLLHYMLKHAWLGKFVRQSHFSQKKRKKKIQASKSLNL